MSKEEMIEILKNAECSDACQCIFDLYGYDKDNNCICKATDPPIDPWIYTGTCPFCKALADMLEK